MSALVVAAAFATCVGSATAALSVLGSTIFPTASFPESHQLVSIYNSYPAAGTPKAGNSAPDLFDRRSSVDGLAEVALYTRTSYALDYPGTRQRVPALAASGSLLSVLGVAPALGRGFNLGMSDTVESREVIIGQEIWREVFQRSPHAVGANLEIEGHDYAVVGVLAERFRLVEPEPQLITRLALRADELSREGRHRDWYQMVGRLRPGATIGEVSNQIQLLNRRRLAEYPDHLRTEMELAGYHTIVSPLVRDRTDRARPLLVPVGFGALLLLIIGGSTITLVLIRRGESHRSALEPAARLRRRAISESIVLAFLGGLAGLWIGRFTLESHEGWSIILTGLLDPAVSEYVAFVAMAAAVALGVIGGRVASEVGAKGSERVLEPAESGPDRLLPRLLVAQLTASVALMAFAFPFAADARASAVGLGFDSARLTTATISLPDERYPDGASRLVFTRRLLQALEDTPRVGAVAVADQPPFSGGRQPIPIAIASDRAAPTQARPVPNQTVVSPGYFEVMSISLVSGRFFRERDDADHARVAIVDSVLARRLWSGDDPIGQVFWRGRPGEALDPSKALTVVGVVGDVRQGGADDGTRNGSFYVPLAQVPLGFFRVLVRHDGDTPWLGVRDPVAHLDPDLVVTAPERVERQVMASLGLERAPGEFLGTLTLLAILLSCGAIWASHHRDR